MQITLTGRHVDMSDAFRDNVETHLNELMEKHQFSPIDATVVISKERFTFHADVTVHLSRGINLRASGHSSDPYESFQGAMDTLTYNLRRYKKRLMDHHKHHDVHPVEEFPEYVLNGSGESEEPTGAAVIAEVPREVPTLSMEDAVMRFDLSGEAAYVFRNKSSGGINMIFRRKDGNIGWLDPAKIPS